MLRKVNIANFVTCIRIICSIALLFCPSISILFYSLYLIAGFTDMIDGPIARKTNSVSDFGSKLDSVADFIFVLVCLIKLLPILEIKIWIFLWIGIIAIIKIANFAVEIIEQKRFIAVHSLANKITGVLLFILPLTIKFIELQYSAIIVCVVATFAALQEGILLNWKYDNFRKII